MGNFTDTDKQIAEYREKISRLNTEAAARFQDPQWRQEKAQAIGSKIYEGFVNENLVDLMTEVERLPLDGRSYIREVRGMKAFHISRGGYIDESQVHSEAMEIPRDIVGFHTSEMEDRLEVNFAETADTLVQLGQRRLDAAVNQRVLSTFQAAVPSSSAYYTGVSGLGLSALNDALAAVEDETMTGEVVIVGRATMTRQILDEIADNNSYGAFLPETNEQLLRRGVLGEYRGSRIITLKNYKDGDDNSYFPANELWILGRDAGKTAFFGGPKVKQWLTNNWYWHYQMRMDYGVVVIRPSHTRRIVDTSISA